MTKIRTGQSKILERSQAAERCASERKQGRVVGFTSGTFDLLHPGHVSCLEHARSLCDVLAVGVNTDHSVRSYKGALRPVQDENSRVAVVAALECVDYVFLFNETNTNQSVRMLKPDVYIKGGDYSAGSLSSAPIVESYGGRVAVVEFVPEHSSSSLIDRIVSRFAQQEASCLELPAPERRAAVFLDRDGTLNEHIDYLHEPERFKLLPGVMPALKKIREAGFRLVVVTNQPGIGIGYFSCEEFFRVNKELLKAAWQAGVLLDRVFFCPHSVGDECACRKPKPALVHRAVKELNLELRGSFVIGDMTSDVELAQRAGCRSILVKTGWGGKDALYSARPDYVAADLEEAAAIVAASGHCPEIQPLPGRIRSGNFTQSPDNQSK